MEISNIKTEHTEIKGTYLEVMSFLSKDLFPKLKSLQDRHDFIDRYFKPIGDVDMSIYLKEMFILYCNEKEKQLILDYLRLQGDNVWLKYYE